MTTLTEKEFLQALGLRIMKLRLAQGRSRLSFAKELATDEKHLRLIESGEINMGVGYAYRIANQLGIEISDLVKAF